MFKFVIQWLLSCLGSKELHFDHSVLSNLFDLVGLSSSKEEQTDSKSLSRPQQT